MEVLTSLAGLLLGLLVGWFLWRRGKPGAAERAESQSRLEVAKRRLCEAEADRKFAVDRAADLQRVLKCEHQLLDSVADRSGVVPRDFRRIIARDYLHPEDPCREMFLDDPVEVEARFEALTSASASRASTSALASIGAPTLGHSPNAQASGGQPSNRLLARKDEVLAERERELGETRVAIAELRTKVERLVQARADQTESSRSTSVIDLREDQISAQSDTAQSDTAQSDTAESDTAQSDTADAASASGLQDRVSALEAELAEAYWALDQIAEAPGRVTALNQEVAVLRGRLADQSIDRSAVEGIIAEEVGRRQQLESYLVVLLEDLDQARAKVDESQLDWER